MNYIVTGRVGSQVFVSTSLVPNVYAQSLESCHPPHMLSVAAAGCMSLINIPYNFVE